MATTLSSGNGSTSVGFVREVTGQATATSSEGVTRVLQVGDMVFADEVIQTDGLGSILVEFNDGSSLALGRDSQAMLDQEVIGFDTSAEPSDSSASVDELQAAIAAGEDPSAILAAPAAGPAAAGTAPDGGGIVVTSVDRIGDSTTPESGFETTGLSDARVEGADFVAGDIVAPSVASIDLASAGDSAIEGIEDLAYDVTLTGTTTTAINYTFQLGGGGSTAESNDYSLLSFTNGVTLNGAGEITVPAGVSGFTVNVDTTPDTVDEPDETVELTIDGVTAVGTIIDNDAAPTISSITDDTESEGTDLVHTVTLSNASTSDSTFAFSLAGNTASASDFGAPSFSNGVTLVGDSLIVPAGVTSFTVNIPTIEDTIHEGAETLDLGVGGLSAVGTILDNDPAPSVMSITDDTELEGTDLVHIVTLSGAAETEISFAFTLVGNTASADDFGAPSFSDGVTLSNGTLTVPAGVSGFSITIPTIIDAIDEADETLDVSVGGLSAVGTILDGNEEPRIMSITDDEEFEGTDLVHTVTLTHASTLDISFAFTLAGNTASASDFGSPTFSDGVTLSGGNLNVPAGVTSFTITIPTITDTLVEGDETLDVSVGGVSGVGTILDDDEEVSILSVSDDTEIEGTDLVHVVSLSAETTAATTFNFDVSDITASAADHGSPSFSNGVTLSGSTLTVPAGVSSFTVTIPTVDDTQYELSETLSVSVGGASGLGTILDNDDSPTVLSVTNDTEYEGTNLVHTVTLSAASDITTGYAFSLSGNTATAGVDFLAPAFTNGVTLVGGNLMVPAGVSTFSIVIPTVDDVAIENPETLGLSVGGKSAVGTILDNDQEEGLFVSIEANDPSAHEAFTEIEEPRDDGQFTVDLHEVNTTGGPITVYYTVSGTAGGGADYIALTGSVVIPAGQQTALIDVLVLDDLIPEGSETVIVTLTSTDTPSVTAGGNATVVIGDNDFANVTIQANDPVANEVDGGEGRPDDGQFTVDLGMVNNTGGPITVSYSVSGTATGGGDYITLTGTVVIPAGQQFATIDVSVINDSIFENPETVIATLTGTDAPGITASGNATVTIGDNDNAHVTISANDPSAHEQGPDDGQFTVDLGMVNTTGAAITVNYTVTGTATNGSDYTTITNSVQIAAGQQTAVIDVSVIDDILDENSETVIITLNSTNTPNITAGGFATVTIGDNDGAVTIRANDPDGHETGPDDGQFTVDLGHTNNTGGPITVNYTVTGSASGGSDYTALTGSVVIAAGQQTALIDVSVINDTLDENNETVIVTLNSTNTPGISASGNATVTIVDNDGNVTISANDPNAHETGPDNGQFTVDLGHVNNTGGPITVNYTVTGTATGGSDYTALTGTVVIAAGQQTALIDVSVLDDPTIEPAETVIVTLNSTNTPGITAGGNATVTILDNDENPNNPPDAKDDYGLTSLASEYYAYTEGVDGGNLENIAQVQAFVAGNTADANFVASSIDYAHGVLDLAVGNNLQTFLGADAASLTYPSGSHVNGTDAILHMNGFIDLDAGDYSFQVTADDGYQILIDGVEVARVDGNQPPTTTPHAPFNVAVSGFHVIEIFYWDQGGAFQFQPTLSKDGGGFIPLGAYPIASTGYTTSLNTPFALQASEVLGNDTDPDGHTLTVTGVEPIGVNGTASLSGTTLTFTPTPGHTGPASYDYTISDGHGGSDTATVHLFVLAGPAPAPDAIQAANTVQIGDDGDNILVGDTGNDSLTGGAGNDILTGGTGEDLFIWRSGDEGTAASPADDQITDFSVAEGDSLQLGDLLTGISGSEDGDALDGYLHFEQSGDHVVISVNTAGSVASHSEDASAFDSGVTQTITLQNTQMADISGGGSTDADIINNLLTNSNLDIT